MGRKTGHDLRKLIDDRRFLEYHKKTLKRREFNAFDVLRYSDYEIRHSNVLAWLLQPDGTHRLGPAVSEVVRQRRAREFGCFNYQSRQHLPDGGGGFCLNDGERLDQCIRSLQDSEVTDLEAAVRPPAELTQPTSTSRPRSHRQGAVETASSRESALTTTGVD